MYYEAILQLRPINKTLIEFALQQIKNSDCNIVKEEELKTGINLYLSSKRFAVTLTKRLKKKFNGTVKVTKTLHTRDRQTSKNVYRITICFRLKQ
ncbi:MAG: 60S ribosomal export protein NMD3 [Nanoarchaeota archaeon]|nr:60S ribosomal export protein NMD3 [Nanoarchaeota archaeon]MBU1445119.1 60S ribosomal export protein NMD3 [Nanoarchaeota archaeon]MBU2420095.1 60S ribosomal export protein NMD3 [Nanoarchaeota archaeon]MBU2475546.1 60S ribosomal export protein NMD3 [Nanoarchaeota archaeon]MBU3940964.1 60S ribosomal export protein NMD3 [Nanoarchaeota archaeon]